MLGFAVRQVRKEKGVNQDVVADACGVTQATVSRWETFGELPEAHVPAVLYALNVSMKELRLAAARSRPNQPVKSREALDAWRDAVGTDSALQPLAKLAVLTFALPDCLHEESWVSEARNVQRLMNIDTGPDLPGEWRDHFWNEALNSPYLQQIGSGGGLYQLKFPGEWWGHSVE